MMVMGLSYKQLVSTLEDTATSVMSPEIPCGNRNGVIEGFANDIESFRNRLGEPGRLMMRQVPATPLTPRDSIPNGIFPNVAARIASARPGTARSMTRNVPSG